MHTILAKRCVGILVAAHIRIPKNLHGNTTCPSQFWIQRLWSGGISFFPIVHHLIMIMTRKEAVYEELWWFSVSSRITANFLKDFDHALSFNLRSALYCPIIGSPLPINWCRDRATEIGHKIVTTSRDVNVFLCSIMLRICTNSIQVEYAKIFCLNRKKLENAWKCPKLVPKRYSEILREPSACYVDHVYGI